MMLVVKCIESLAHAVEVLWIPRVDTLQTPLQGFWAVCAIAESLKAQLVSFPKHSGLSCGSQSCHPVRSATVVHKALKVGA